MLKQKYMGVIFTNHALKRLTQRGLTQSDVYYTFKHSDKQEKGKSPDSWKFTKTYGQQTIKVIAKKNDRKQWVILSCWSKIKGGYKPIFKQKSEGENWFWKISKKIWKI